MAAAICSGALVPALALLRDGMTLASSIDKRHLLLIYGVSKMEEQMAIASATWSEASTSGDFVTEGHASIRFSATRSDDPANGGIANRLMSISVTTYSDDDGDDTLDATEARTTLTTKIAKLVTYEYKASN